MGDFFRGRRRKFGVVTLLMACLLAAGWARSFVLRDLLDISTGQFRKDEVDSVDGSICWTRDDDRKPHSQFIHWHGSPFMTLHRSFEPIEDEWVWCGFATFNVVMPDSRRIPAWIIPYWSIVIPLTLISAFLLLSKPRKSTLKKISESVTNEAA